MTIRQAGWAACLFVVAACLPVFAQSGPAQAEEPENLDRYIGRELAIENRASRAGVTRLYPHSCPPFYLRDEFDRIIDETSTLPVSVSQTCMKCHDVGTVTGGYHFQMGRDEMFDPHKVGEPAPLHKSPGMYGKWQPLYQRELAPKSFERPDEIDMTSFEFVATCGICHPGGGPAQFDRGGLRYDMVMSQDPSVRTLYDGDYYDAAWHQSGSLEPDCLICHLETYEYSERAQQIKRYNFKWAATAGAGFGDVSGSVKDGEIPKVEYGKGVFRPDGRVYLTIRRPQDRACLFCHDISGVQKRGTTWSSNYLPDVHTDIGLSCIDCHPGDIRHNFAKGYSSSQTVRDDLDGSGQSCLSCHYETGDFGAPAFDHGGLPPLHLERLSCEACHITTRPFLSARVVDVLTGKVMELPNDPDPSPPAHLMFGALWGKVRAVSPAAPMEPFTREELEVAANLTVGTDSPIRAAFEAIGGGWALPDGPFRVRDFIQGDPALVDTAAKRALMLLALEQTPEKDFSAVSVFRNKAYKMTPDGLHQTTASWRAKRVGHIAQYPVARAFHERNGERVIVPEGYQLGVFWAYEDRVGDQSVVRPLFVEDMKTAWDYLQDNKLVLYPAKSSSGEGGSKTEAPVPTEEDMRNAIQTRLDAYLESERTELGVYDDTFDTLPEVNTEEEIGLVAWAISRTMKRLPSSELYYINGEKAYRVMVGAWSDPFGMPLLEAPLPGADEPFLAITRVMERDNSGKVKRQELRLAAPFDVQIEEVDPARNVAVAELAKRLPWTIAHGVEPAGFALGAQGCTDCHSSDSTFFFGRTVVVPFGKDGLPVTRPMYEQLGYRRGALLAGAWREGVLKPLTKWLVPAVALLALLHFVLFGSRDTRKGLLPDVQRFAVHERLGHLILMVTVTFLAVTGFCFLLGKDDPLGALARYLHTLLGYVAVAGYAVIFFAWTRDMIFNTSDIRWLRGFGGYLGGPGHLPAGKFNAGQKILFWITIGLGVVLAFTGIIMGLNRDRHFAGQEWMYTIHDIAALLMILVLIGHIYLGVLVVPHSLRSLFGGWVSSVWAKEHHPDWRPARRVPPDVRS